MKIRSMAGCFALWCAFLAAGTWILPMGVLSVVGQPAAAAPLMEEDANAYLTAQAVDFLGMVDSGGFDLATHSGTSVDLNSDGSADPILIVPSRADGGGGCVLVSSGNDSSLLLEARQSANEMGFAHRVAVVAGVEDADVKTLLISSFERDTAETHSFWLVLRAFSGRSGSLLAVSRQRIETSDLTMLDFDRIGRDFRRAGDLDGTGLIDTSDVLAVASNIQSPAAKTEADLDCDGGVTGLDVVETALRVDVGGCVSNDLLERLAGVEEGEVLMAGDGADWYGVREAQPHHWTSWRCWGVALFIAGELALLLAEIVLCGAIAVAPTPAVILCVLAAICGVVSILAQMIEHQIHCNLWEHGDDNWIETADEILDAIALITGICAVLGGGFAAWKEILERGGGIKNILERLLRGYGLEL